jgi:predicted membrane-bound dolichyl-phosphate-mannose-protein mannosyltransferase
MCTVAPAMVTRLKSAVCSPLILLALVSVLSLAARVAWLGEPCQSPCNKAGDHVLVFDEAYYVNAARVIAGLRPPQGAHYADAPAGTDPNAEHPQGAKLVMAGSIELFGDGPLAWRLGSLVFGSLAILGMFALVRAAGGGQWLALGASTLMACDNLLIVHGRIGTLDIYALAPMLFGVALYLRGRPILAGLVIAIAACFKEIAPYALLALALVEMLRIATARGDPAGLADRAIRRALVRFLVCCATAAAVFVVLLGVMDRIATPYADSAATLITGGPFAHIAHMISYAANLTSPNGPKGIASYPWQWLFDYKPITYLRINPSNPGDEFHAIHPVTKFLGMMSPPIMLLAIPALVFAAYRIALACRRRTQSSDPPPVANQLAIVGLAWFLGTFIPFELQSVIYSRTSYIYYMVTVMPGIYVAIVYMLAWVLRRRLTVVWAIAVLWAVSVLAAAVVMYPFTPLL